MADSVVITKDWNSPSYWPPNDFVSELLGDNNIMVKTIFPWEDAIKGASMSQTIRGWFFWPSVAAILYCVIVRTAPRIMAKYPAFKLKYTLAAWNLLLSVFSIVGFLRLFPLVVSMLLKTNLTWMTCTPPGSTYAREPFGVWVCFFAFSKYVELFDTFFLIVRKRPVNFLHWFHHATVLVYTFDACNREVPIGIFFTVMNLFVHSIMYFYYFLTAVGKPPAWGKAVTVLQISQMFGGIFFIVAATKNLLKFGRMTHWKYLDAAAGTVQLPPIDVEGSEKFFSENGCNGDMLNYALGFCMYGAYLYLFCEFFVQRYILKGESIVERGGKQAVKLADNVEKNGDFSSVSKNVGASGIEVHASATTLKTRK